ncbi:recombinase family protein [Vreelandella alkaliphila]|uniref:Recombinase family protein n=1 Tax=Vreelandella alkaliphila TaxID=272774 RepID=A0AAJ2RZV8_9GAMM|nr:recombinase family protein [Halomonas alkaliphila]MDX5979609.1 recombinase family protein [Halomonas alkaliphila]
MFIRAYLRASTTDQDSMRAAKMLDSFAAQHSQKIACRYVENDSGANANRVELRRLLSDAQPGDVILVESIDRLSRMPVADWERLRREIDDKGLRIVATDLPTSHAALSESHNDEFTARMLDAVNSMMLDMMAAIARKDYEQRRERQQQGIEKAKAEGKFKGRTKDTAKRQKIRDLLGAGFSIRKTASLADASPSTVQSVKAEMKAEEESQLTRLAEIH